MFGGTRWRRVVITAVVAAVAGCDNPVGPEVHVVPVAAEVYLRGTEERIAYVHGDHWHGRLEVEEGEVVELDVRFLDEDGGVLPLGGEYTVRAEVAPGHQGGIVGIDNHGDHLEIAGEAAGETRIVIHWWHGDHADWTSPAIRVVVHEPSPQPVGAEIYRRGTDQRLAYVHGDHWHGRITLEEGEDIEVDVRFLDEEGSEIPLASGFTVRAEIASGHPSGIVNISSHGDHLDLEAASVGETRIVIHLWHDDHAEWTTPALRVEVR